MNKEIENKSKNKHLVQGIQNWTPGQRSHYLNRMSRNECSTIFKARTRMLDVKNNFRGKYENNTCRLCGIEEETQDHILNICKIIHKDETLKTPTSDLFDNNIAKLKQTANRISIIMQKLTITK